MYLAIWQLILLIVCSAMAGGATGMIVMAIMAVARDDGR